VSTQRKNVMFDRMVERYERISSVELTEDVHGLCFELLTEFGVVFLVDFARLKVKIYITNSTIEHLFLEQ
jgi:hypothetical protein